MIRIVKHNENIIDRTYRMIKSFGRSRRDVSTSYNVAPWGDDSAPILNSDLVHSSTGADETVILGVINKNQIASPGEKRIFATNEGGDVVVAIYLKRDGTIEIAGNSDNTVKFSKLDTAIQKLSADINIELGKIAAGIATGGGAYAVVPISIDLSAAKNDKIKTN